MTRRRYIACCVLAIVSAAMCVADWIACAVSYRYAAEYRRAQLKQDAGSSEVRTWRGTAGYGKLDFEMEYYRRTRAGDIEALGRENSSNASLAEVARAGFKTYQQLDAARARDGPNGLRVAPIRKPRRPTRPTVRPLFERGPIPGSYIINLHMPIWVTSLLPAPASLLFWRLRGKRRQPGHCQQCGYSLTGNCTGICPECGTGVAFR